MAEKRSIPLQKLIDDFHLTVAYGPEDYGSIAVTSENLNRHGLQLVGFTIICSRQVTGHRNGGEFVSEALGSTFRRRAFKMFSDRA